MFGDVPLQPITSPFMLAPIPSSHHSCSSETARPPPFLSTGLAAGEHISFPEQGNAAKQDSVHTNGANKESGNGSTECQAPPIGGFIPRQNSLKVTFREDIRKTVHSHAHIDRAFVHQGQAADNYVLKTSKLSTLHVPHERNKNGVNAEVYGELLPAATSQLVGAIQLAGYHYQNGLTENTNRQAAHTLSKGHGYSPSLSPSTSESSSCSSSVSPTGHSPDNSSCWVNASRCHGGVQTFDHLRAEADLIGLL